MKIVGLKCSHDAAVACIEDGQLLFSTELEKINENPRYSDLKNFAEAEQILRDEGIDPERARLRLVVDGYKKPTIKGLRVAPYNEFYPREPQIVEGFTEHLGGRNYISRTHMISHLVGGVITSQWAKTREDNVYVLSWDGSQEPRVHRWVPTNGGSPQSQFKYEGMPFRLCGVIYSIMGYYWGPFKLHNPLEELGPGWGKSNYGQFDWPGKLMAYIGLGQSDNTLINEIDSLYDEIEADFQHHHGKDADNALLTYQANGTSEHQLCRLLFQFLASIPDNPLSDADVLHSIHTWLERKLVAEATRLIPFRSKLIFVGGSALNIKWNTALRDTAWFEDVWVPPFPNDAGSALGAAAAEWVERSGGWDLNWSVFSGPRLIEDEPTSRWTTSMCSPRELARLLYSCPDKPFIVLNGRAELGPRALGHRSILMSPKPLSNKSLLNEIKGREPFRPVAPIALEECARFAFNPGTPDPYMLFEHKVPFDTEKRCPAIVHVDRTARLQTVSYYSVSPSYSQFLFDLMTSYRRHDTIGILCNTSANRNGSGFFPSVSAATRWASEQGVDYVWANGKLHCRLY